MSFDQNRMTKWIHFSSIYALKTLGTFTSDIYIVHSLISFCTKKVHNNRNYSYESSSWQLVKLYYQRKRIFVEIIEHDILVWRTHIVNIIIIQFSRRIHHGTICTDRITKLSMNVSVSDQSPNECLAVFHDDDFRNRTEWMIIFTQWLSIHIWR